MTTEVDTAHGPYLRLLVWVSRRQEGFRWPWYVRWLIPGEIPGPTGPACRSCALPTRQPLDRDEFPCPWCRDTEDGADRARRIGRVVISPEML